MTTITDVNINPIPKRDENPQGIILSKSPFTPLPGQIIKASVVNMVSHDEALLNIEGYMLRAKTPAFLNESTQLTLKVTTVEPDIQMSIMQLNAPKETPPPLLPYLAKQLPATQLMQLMEKVYALEGKNTLLAQALQQFMGNVPQLQQITTTLQKAIQYSGYFAEQVLIEAEKNNKNFSPKKDLKLALINIIQQLKGTSPLDAIHRSEQGNFSLPLDNSPPQPMLKSSFNLDELPIDMLKSALKEHADGVLSRITATQIQQSQQDPNMPFGIRIEIPIQLQHKQDVIPITIREHQSITPGEDSHFSMDFALNLEHLGGIQGHVSLLKEGLYIQWHAESEQTLYLLNKEESTVTRLLADIGLTCRQYDCHLGLKVEKPSLNDHILDIKI